MRESLRKALEPLFWLGGLHAGVQAVGYIVSGGFGLAGAALTLLVETPLIFRIVFFIGAFPIVFGGTNYLIGLLARRGELRAQQGRGIPVELPYTNINYGHIQMGSVADAERTDEPSLGSGNVHEEQTEVLHASELPLPQELPPELVSAPYL